MVSKRRPPRGRVITFYSYKGGTGRSMALANIAWLLALRDERVLVIDWDLEAPGIHRYFHPMLEDRELTATEGLLDFVEKLETRAAMSAEPLDEEEIDIIEYVTMLKWPANSSIRWEQFGPHAKLDLLVAGQQGPGYSAKLSNFNWVNFYQKLGGQRLLNIAREQMRRVYDYILIDSRTGVSDTSGICTVEMPDTLVVCFTLNDQSITGASSAAQSVLKQQQTRKEPRLEIPESPPFLIFPVPTRVEINSERAKREVALALAQRRFGQFVETLPGESSTRYWGSVQQPYFAFYAFEEIPAVFGDLPHDDLSLLAPVKQLTRAITRDPSLDFPPLHPDEAEAERLRKEVLGWYLRKKDSELSPVELVQKVYDDLPAESREVMRKLMLRLVQVNAGAAPTPTSCQLDELDRSLQEMAGRLAELHVVQVSGMSVYVADRRIVEEWPLLHRWVADDQAFLLRRQGLTAQARTWILSAQDANALLRGGLLNEAEQLRAQRGSDLSPVEQQFVSASAQATASDAGASAPSPAPAVARPQAAPAAPAKATFRWIGAAALFLVAAGTGLTIWLGGQQRQKAQAARSAAIVALAEKTPSGDPLLSALLLEETQDYSPTPDDRNFALDLAKTPIPDRLLTGSAPFRQLEFSRDGKRLVTASDSGAEIWSTETGKREKGLGAHILSASFNGWVPDRAKSRGASGQIDRVVTVSSEGVVQVWSLDGTEIMKFAAKNPDPAFFGKCTNRLAQGKASYASGGRLDNPVYARFSPDEVVLLVAYESGAVVMISPKNGACFDVYAPAANGPAVFSPEGEWAATGAGSGITFFHVQDWKQQQMPLGAESKGRLYTEQKFTILDVASTPRALISSHKDSPCQEMTAAIDCGKADAGSLTNDNILAIAAGSKGYWDTLAGTSRNPFGPSSSLSGHTKRITAIAFDPGATHVVTASEDQTIRFWPLQRSTIAPLAPWNDIIDHFRNATQVCLSAAQRMQLLNENAETAQASAGRCEARVAAKPAAK